MGIAWPVLLIASLMAGTGVFILVELVRGKVEEPLLAFTIAPGLVFGGGYGILLSLQLVNPI
jgi:hypothetical protein